MASEFAIERTEQVMNALEGVNNCRHPLRSIPLDMIADAVLVASRVEKFEELSPREVAHILNGILGRNNDLLMKIPNPDSLDTVGIFNGSSFLIHEGVARLSEGG